VGLSFNANEGRNMKTRISIVIGLILTAACSSGGEESPLADRAGRTGRATSGLTTCEHALCAAGGPLEAACDPCAVALCGLDPYCCSVAWDGTCVGEVTSICGQSCSAPPPDTGPSTCAHPVCAAGAPLVSGCEPCAAQLCAQDPYCCTVAWDGTCVNEVASICGTACN
jgi:hypothetical protein